MNDQHIDIFEEMLAESREPASNWMMTFADLLSLLLVFFLLIYSMTTIKAGDWKKLKETIGDSFKTTKIIDHEHTTQLNAPIIDINKGVDIDYLLAILESKIKDDAYLKNNIKLNRKGSSLIITLNNDNLFQGNSPILNEDSRVLLFVIGDALQKVNNKIVITGYNDKSYSDDAQEEWNLTLARVVKVASSMREHGNLSKLEALVINTGKIKIGNNKGSNVNITIKPYIKE